MDWIGEEKNERTYQCPRWMNAVVLHGLLISFERLMGQACFALHSQERQLHAHRIKVWRWMQKLVQMLAGPGIEMQGE